MANRLPDNAFTSRQALDPSLRKVARFLPRGYALNRGYKFQRALMLLMGNAGRLPNVPVIAVNEHVKVRMHRPAGLPEPAPALLWIHGGRHPHGYRRPGRQVLPQAISPHRRRGGGRRTPPGPRAPVPDTSRRLLCSPAVAGASTMGGPESDRGRRSKCRRTFRGGGGTAGARPQRGQARLSDAGVPDAGRPHRREPRRPQARSCGPKADNQLAWRWYLNGADPVEAAPATSATICPGCLQPGSGSGSWTSSIRSAWSTERRLREAGVPVHEEIVPGAFHAFDQIADKAPISVNFFASQRDHLWAALAAPTDNHLR